MRDINNVEYVRLQEELKKAFKQLEDRNLTEEECTKLKRRIFEGLDVLSFLIYEHSRHPFFTNLYRVRKAKRIDKEEDINDVKTFYYPSPDKCNTARANIEGCPVLYVSDNSCTAIKEANCENGEIAYLSEWKLNSDKPLSICMLFTDELDDKHYWKHIENDFRKKLQEKMTSFAEDQREELKELHRLCCSMFTSDDYTVSSLIGHYLLYEQRDRSVDALLYPSQADAKSYCNLAVATHFADKHLSLVSLKKVKVLVNGGEECKTELIEEAEVRDGKISWKNNQSDSYH
jgi:hypothetical protein